MEVSCPGSSASSHLKFKSLLDDNVSTASFLMYTSSYYNYCAQT